MSWSLLNTGTAGMHSRSCRSCFRNYILALEPGAPNSRPYLLVCGHVFCGACLQDKGTHAGCEFACPTCKMVTRIPGAGGLSQLPLDYYSLGVLAAYNYSCGVPRSKQILGGGSQAKLRQPLLTDGGALTEARGIPEDVRLNLTTGKERRCAECERQKAILFCKHCQEDFCDSCFKKVHGNAKVLKNHKVNKIDPSDCENCEVHGKLYAYCCELGGGGGGGSGVACADCIADSEHSDHDHTLLDAKKEELSMQLPKAIVVGQARVLKLKEALREFEKLQSELQPQLHTVVCSIHESIHSLCSMVQARGAELVFKLKDMEVWLNPILTRGTSVLHESLLSNCVTLDTACRMARGQQFCTRDVQKVVDQLLTMDVPELCSVLLEDSLDLQCDLDATQLFGHIKELGTILFPTRLLEYGKSMSAAAGSDRSPVGAMPLSPMQQQQQQQAHGSRATTRGHAEKGPIGPDLKLTLNLQGPKHADPPTATWSKKGGAVSAAAALSSASLARCLFPGISGDESVSLAGMMTAGGEPSSVQRCKIGNAKSSRNRPSWISQDAMHSEQVMLTHVVNPRHFYVQYYAARYRNEKLNLALSKYCMAQTKNSSAIQTLSIGEVLCMRSCVSNKWHRVKIISIRAGEELCGSVQAEGGEGTASLGLLRSIALQMRVFDERESENDAVLGVATAAEMTSSVEAGHVADEGIVKARGSTAGQTLHVAERSGCGFVEADYLSLLECTHPKSPGVCGSITSLQKREDADGKRADARGKGHVAKWNFSTEKSAERAREICETSKKIGVVSGLLTCSEEMEMIDGVLECGWEHEDNCAAAPDRHPGVEGEAQASADTQSSKPALVSQGASSFPIDKVTRLNVFLVDEGRTEVFYVRSKRALKQSRRNAACAVSDLQPHLRRPDHELLNLFEKVPAAAVRCALKDVVPFVAGQGWSAESSKAFAEMLQGQIVHMVVAARAGDVFIVDLVKSPHNQVENDVPVSLRDALVFLELARFQCDSAPLCVPDHRPGRSPAFIPPSNLQPLAWLCLMLSHINSPSDFYVQQVSTTKCLLELKGALQRFYRDYRNDWTVVHPTVGQLCVAQFSADQQWYRAQVIGLPGKGDVEVRYVDYGNTERTSVSCIRKLGNMFLQLPELAVPCTLADIRANGECWTVAAMERFHQIVDNKHLWSLVTDNRSGNHVSVHLFVEPAQLLSKMLVDEGFAQRFGLRSVSLEELKLAKERAAVQTDVPEGPCGVEAAAVWWSGRARRGTTTMPTHAFVSFVRSPASFYLQPDEALGNFLPTLKEMLEERFGGKPRPLAQGSAAAAPASGADLAEGSLCALYSTNHRTWARARIQSLHPDGQIQVLLLDYGDAAVVAPSELRPIDMACSRYPAMAVHCCLACLTPTGGSAEWSAGACDFLSDAISEKYCYVKEMGEMERDDPLPVQLTCRMAGDKDHLRDIGNLLVLQGLAFHVKRPIADPGVVHRRMGEDIVAACVKEMSRMVVPPQQWAGVPYLAPELPASDTFSLVVSHVSASGRIYGHLASNDAVLQKLMESMDLECGSSSNKNSSLSGLVDVPFFLGQPCVVQLSGGWYRGQILNVQTNSVQVRYVDHGGEDEVEPGAVHVTDRFTHVPPLCLECVLSSPHLDEGDAQKDEVVEYLSRMLCGQTVSMTLKVPCSEASLPLQVDVYTEQQGSLEALLVLAEPLDGEQCSSQGQGPMEGERKPTSTEGQIQVREVPHFFESVVVHALQVDDSGEEKGAGLGALGEWGEEEDEEDMAATERPGGSGDQDEQEEDVMWDEPLVFTLQQRPTSLSFMTLPPPGHYYPVSVTHLELPNQVYIRLSASTPPTPLLEGQEYEQGLNPNLIAALIKIHTSPIRLSPQKDFNVGSLCMAPFSEDGRWCRARVKCGPRMLAGGDSVLLVEYVDFGSCYEHRPSELRAIPVELLEFPVQTVQVRLWGLSPPPFEGPASAAAGAGERLPYGPEWPRCTLLAVRSCVDGVPLVASTVTDARGPCVALYHAAEPGGPLVYQHIPEQGLAQWEVGAEGARPPKHG
uniref:RING finger protein 17-like isoform X1 n=1 Tax=Petromyzon marinus TaxID=7757 RepID=A0AAJ7XHT4_PETMA|nr:RING finger protein 17-like isoform X1 [Petromyzon marinus]XP_032835234.1 RING finger protein 17-like isoform X1 [Petromyzon marinus]